MMKRLCVILLTFALLIPPSGTLGQGGMGPGPGVKSYASGPVVVASDDFNRADSGTLGQGRSVRRPIYSSGPTVVASDDFNRADSGTLGQSLTPSYLRPVSFDLNGLFVNWTNLEGSPQIISNTAGEANNETFSVAYWSANTFNDNQFSRAEVVVVSPNSNIAVVEVAVRRSGTAGNYNGYSLAVDGDSYNLYKTVSGTDTTLIGDTGLTVTAGDIIELRASGTTISFYLNSSLVNSVTDSSLTSGAPGINFFKSTGGINPRLDNWQGGNL